MRLPRLSQALQREFDVWKRLRHPHILQFYGACSIADSPFFVCQLMTNGDALTYLRRYPDASRAKLVRMLVTWSLLR